MTGPNMMRNIISSVKLEEKVQPLGDKNVPFRDEGIKQYTQMYILYLIQCDVKKLHCHSNILSCVCHFTFVPFCWTVVCLFCSIQPLSAGFHVNAA